MGVLSPKKLHMHRLRKIEKLDLYERSCVLKRGGRDVALFNAESQNCMYVRLGNGSAVVEKGGVGVARMEAEGIERVLHIVECRRFFGLVGHGILEGFEDVRAWCIVHSLHEVTGPDGALLGDHIVAKRRDVFAKACTWKGDAAWVAHIVSSRRRHGATSFRDVNDDFGVVVDRGPEEEVISICWIRAVLHNAAQQFVYERINVHVTCLGVAEDGTGAVDGDWQVGYKFFRVRNERLAHSLVEDVAIEAMQWTVLGDGSLGVVKRSGIGEGEGRKRRDIVEGFSILLSCQGHAQQLCRTAHICIAQRRVGQ